MSSNIYCPPHLRPGFNQISQNPIVSGFKDEEPVVPQGHDELIRFISDAWSNVLKEYGKNAYYVDGELQNDN